MDTVRELGVKGTPVAKEGGPDRSMADFFWCLMAAQRGHGVEETADKLLEVSAKAQENARRHDEGYALITAERRRRCRAGTHVGQGIDVATSHRPADSLTAPLLNCTVHLIEMESLWQALQRRAGTAQ